MNQAIIKSILTELLIFSATLFLFAAHGIFLIDLVAYIIKYRPFHLTSTTEFLSLFHISWAEAPTFWVGTHDFLSSVPISITFFILSLALNWFLIWQILLPRIFLDPSYKQDKKRAIRNFILVTMLDWPLWISWTAAYYIFLVDLAVYMVKYRPFHLTSTTKFLSLLHISWADAPTFWVGAHDFLSSVPISITLIILGFCTFIISAFIVISFKEPFDPSFSSLQIILKILNPTILISLNLEEGLLLISFRLHSCCCTTHRGHSCNGIPHCKWQCIGWRPSSRI